MKPYDLHLQYVFGWSAGAGSRAMDPERSEHSVEEMRKAYNDGYVDGQKARRQANLESAKRHGIVMSAIKPNCIVRNADGNGTHLEYRHPLSLDT